MTSSEWVVWASASLAAVFIVGSTFVLFFRVFSAERSIERENADVPQSSDDDWATQLHAMVESERLDPTLDIDMRMLRTRLALEDIEEDFRIKLNGVVEWALEVLKRDRPLTPEALMWESTVPPIMVPVVTHTGEHFMIPVARG